jgi:hypothetical protein
LETPSRPLRSWPSTSSAHCPLAADLQRINQYPTWLSVPRLPSRSSSATFPVRRRSERSS